jgi:soluble lytic murein transglycosylase-like protein
MRRVLLPSLVGWFLAVPVVATAGGSTCMYKDADGVWVFSNASADARCRKKLNLGSSGVYRPERSPAPSRSPSARVAPSARRAPPAEYEPHLRAAAERYNLPYELLVAVMVVESNYDPRAVSHKGAMGLMQLMPRTSQEMYVSDALDPQANIEGGARYLRVLANRYEGDLAKTLAAYNAGPDAVKKAGEQIPNYPETREYVRRVLDHYGRLKGQGDRG